MIEWIWWFGGTPTTRKPPCWQSVLACFDVDNFCDLVNSKGCCIVISRLRKTCWSLSCHCQLDPFGICQNQGYQQKESGRTHILKFRLFCYCWLDFLQGEMVDSQSEDSMTAQISASTRLTTEPNMNTTWMCHMSLVQTVNKAHRVREGEVFFQTWIAMTCI